MIPNKILVVDDEADMEELIDLLFRRDIRKKRVMFIFAKNGKEALEVLEKDPDIDILLCDINMPVMDGLSLLRELNQMPRLLKTIMVTAYGNMENIRTSMNEGAFDFVTKPIDFDDLKTTIDKATHELNRQKEGEAARKQLPLTQKALEETDQRAKFLEELDQLKSRFFTNLSHEFRTPLTVILGMSAQIAKDPSRWLQRGNQLIQRNSNHLLDLVNQILDLRKLESGQMELRLHQADILIELRYISESFQSYAQTKNISLSFQTDEQEIWMDYDREKIYRITNNLLSNAIKFTPQGGQVILSISNQGTHLLLTIRDTGMGIPEDQLTLIFDRFYQVDGSSTREGEGTGIGLALTQELLKLMKGDIKVESTPGEGSKFSIALPITQNEPRILHGQQKDKPVEIFHVGTEAEYTGRSAYAAQTALPSLLIIEDNPGIVEYLYSCLEDQYELFSAPDGEAGIEAALEQVPDLIITDVMMPGKNGYEVVETLKLDERTSHIPVVILTAKADQASRLEGFQRGADAYLPKPFDQKELEIRLAKLLEIRQRLQQRYQDGLVPEASSEDPQIQMEDAFIIQARALIIKHLDDSNYRGDALMKAMGLSRTNLHRKLKALTGLSSSRFIRKVRVEEACKMMLEDPNLRVSEIAYATGFSDPKYFNRVFSEYKGLSPSEWRKQQSPKSSG
ncbi:MAG: response regulator [Bacteroidota bacterium]